MLTHAIILPTLKIETYGGWGGGWKEEKSNRQRKQGGREIKRESGGETEKKSDMK